MRFLLAITLSVLLWAEPLPVPPNLKADKMPAIPAELFEEIGRYAEFRSASLADWHPLERSILISTRFGNTPQLHRVAMPMGARKQVTFFQERVAGGSYRPGKADIILFSRDVGGGEWYQIYTQDVKTGKVTLLTDGGRTQNGGARWSQDGKQIVYSSTKRNGSDRDIWIMDVDDPKSARLLMQVKGGGWGTSDWSPDGKQLIVTQYFSAERSVLYLFDIASSKLTPITPVEAKDSVGLAKFSADGKSIYFTTTEGSDFERLAQMDLATKQVKFLRPEIQWDVQGLDLTRDRSKMAYVTNEDGISRLRVMDLKTGKDLALPAIPDGIIGGVSWHENGKELGFSLAHSRSVSDVYSIDITTGKLERWTESETGGLDVSEFAKPELIRWKSFDGLSISGFLYRPPGKFTGKRPVIINIHGGPEGQSRPGFIGGSNYYVNELGVAVIYPNVRGSTGYGRKFLSLDNGMKREDSVKDIGALLDWIKAQPNLDSERVMVTGGSYGGYMTLACMTRFNDRLRAGLDVVGIANWVTFLERTESYRRDLRRVEYGDERDPNMRDFLSTISPVNNASKITKPMFIVQGKNDPRVPYTESEQMVQAIRKNGGDVWYLLADDEGHGFAKRRNQDYQFAATVMFVKAHLLR